MTRYWYDLEFLEDGHTIELISIGIVASDGREYHAVVADCDFDRVLLSPWLVANVVPHLPLTRVDVLAHYLAGHVGTSLADVRKLVALDPLDPVVKPRAQVATEVHEFLTGGEGEVELWADYAAYDHVALCQLWGPMVNLPAGVPMFTRDVQQEAAHLRLAGELPQSHPNLEHNALSDARLTRERWLWLKRQESLTALAADLRTHGWTEVEVEVEDDAELTVKPCYETSCPPFENVVVSLNTGTLPEASDEERESDWPPGVCPYDCDKCHDLDTCLCPNCTRVREELDSE